MNRKLLVSVFALALLGLTSFAVTSNITALRPASLDNAASDYWQRHQMASIPVTGARPDLRSSDYFQRHVAEIIAARGIDSTDYAARHPQLNLAQVRDTTDYAARHPGLAVSVATSVDLSDYAARHPGMSLRASRPVDTTDYYFRQPQLSRWPSPLG